MWLFALYKCLDCLWRINKKLIVVIASGERNWISRVAIGENFHFLKFFKNLFISFYSLGFATCACIAYSKINYLKVNKSLKIAKKQK